MPHSAIFRKKYSPLLSGTLILTATGLASRLIGFFYRIYLSRLFGEESMGIYQLISPVMVLVFSLSAAGFQNAVSKFVAEKTATGDYKASVRILLVGFVFSFGISVLCTVFVLQTADFLAAYLLFEKRCAPLLRIAALSFPFAAVHSSINGYFYGVRKAAVPAVSQLVEQLFRVGSVFFLSWLFLSRGKELNVALAAIGLVIGEFGSMVVTFPSSFRYIRRHSRSNALSLTKQPGRRTFCTQHTPASSCRMQPQKEIARRILGFAAPLSANRLCINLLQTIEAACIPAKLQIFGHSNADALSVYGVLTGMALPLIYFPGALTNSVSVLLMPAISEAETLNDHRTIRSTVRRCLSCCMLLGGICCFFFLCLGQYIGTHLFGSEMAGHFIMILSFTCPFLYLNTTLTSILHGLGQTAFPFFLNLTALLLRLLFVFYAIPVYGIKGYLAGMLLGQLLTAVCSLWALRKYL